MLAKIIGGCDHFLIPDLRGGNDRKGDDKMTYQRNYKLITLTKILLTKTIIIS